MTNLNQLYRIFLFAILFCLISNVGYSTQYSWTGTTSISWRTTTNWSPNGIPGSTDTVIIVSQVNNPCLSQNETVGKFTMTSGSLVLLTYTLTINGVAKFDGGTISGSATKAIKPRGTRATFDGTTLNSEVDAICGDVVLSGSVFNYPVRFEQTGSSTGNGAGGNTFNSTAYFKNGGSAYFLLASTNGNTFRDTTTFYVSGSQEIVASKAKSHFEGPIIVNSTNGGVNFGATDGDTCFLNAGVTIKIGSGGFSAGTLVLLNVYQTDSTPQSFTLTGSSVLNISYSKFNGTFTATAPSTVLKYNTFNDSLTLTKTGSTSALCAGGNIFNGVTLIKNHSTAQWRFANEIGDAFNNKVTFYTDSTGLLRPFYVGTSTVINDLLSSGSKIEYAASTGTVVFTGTANQLVHGTKALDFYRIRIDKSVGYISIDTTASISDSLNLVNGNFKTTANHLLSLKAGSKASGNSHSFIDGPIKKIGNSAFTFPIGKEYSYAPAKISAPSSSTDAFTAEYFYNQQQHGSSADTTLGLFSGCSYWNISRTTGTSSPYVYLGWDTLGCGLADTTNLKVANWNGSAWKDRGRDSIFGDAYSGFIKAVTNSLTYGDFTWAYSSIPIIIVKPEFYDVTTFPDFNHSLEPDMCGYNGANTLDPGTSWNELAHPSAGGQALLNKSATILRIPAGTVANYFDWRSGWMIQENHLPSNWHYLERFLDKEPFSVGSNSLPNEMVEFKANSDLICAKPMFTLNMLSSGFEYQLASLFRAKMLNLSTDYIELGNEFENNNEQYKEIFPSVIDYSNAANEWCARLKNYTEFGAKIAVNGSSTPNGVPGRRKLWLENLMKTLNQNAQIDAVVMHQYIGTGLGNTPLVTANVQTMLANSFTNWNTVFKADVNTIDQYKISNSGTQSPEVWITEYNLRDLFSGSTGTWSHALFVASMTLQYLESPKITKIISHTMNGDALFGNIFDDNSGYKGLKNFPKGTDKNTITTKWDFTAMGSALDEIYAAVKNSTYARKLLLETSSPMPPVPPINGNVSYPSLYGWYFSAANSSQAVILNLHDGQIFEIDPVDIFGGTPMDLQFEIISASDMVSGIVGNPLTTGGPDQNHLFKPSIQTCLANHTIRMYPHTILRIIRNNTTTLNIHAPITTVCSGTSTTFEIEGGVPPYSITSSSLLTSLNTNNSVYQFNAPASHSSPQTYTFTVADINHISTTVTFTVHNSGSVAITGSVTTFCPGATAVTLSATITPSEGASLNYKYIWVPDSGVTDLSSLTTSTIDVTPKRTTTYQVYTYDNQCWSRSNEIKITVPLAEVNLGEDIHICSGSNAYLYANSTLSSGSSPTYQWYANNILIPGANGIFYTSGNLYGETQFRIELANGGCNRSDDLTVIVDECCSCASNNPPCYQTNSLIHTSIPTNEVASYFDLLAMATFINSNSDHTVKAQYTANPLTLTVTGYGTHEIEMNGTFKIEKKAIVNFLNCTLKLSENAKIDIESEANVTFTNCTFDACSSSMWDGIFVDQKDEFVPPEIKLVNCSFNNAKNAVVMRSDAGFKIEQSTFDGNYVDLVFDNYQQAAAQTIASGSATTNYLRQNTFTGSNSSFLLNPYSTDYKNAAIKLNEVENLIIGDAGNVNFLNTFSNSSFGIYSQNSNFECYNNTFDDINKRIGDTHSKVDWGSAIRSFATSIYSDNKFYLGNNGSNEYNIIKNVKYGVYNSGPINSYIKSNVFGKLDSDHDDDIISSTCLRLEDTYDKEIVIDEENEFYDYNVGIDISNVTQAAKIDIQNNTFKEAWVIVLYQQSSAWNNTAIKLRNAVYSPIASCSISNNHIGNDGVTGARIGIFCSNVGNLTISGNDIHTIAPHVNSDLYRGIRLQYTPDSYIGSNEITDANYYDDRNNNVIGIMSENTMTTCYDSNILTNLGYGMEFIGDCSISSLIKNEFHDFNIGVYLDFADIGDQGTPDTPNDNKWFLSYPTPDIRADGKLFNAITLDWYYNNSAPEFEVKVPSSNTYILPQGLTISLGYNPDCIAQLLSGMDERTALIRNRSLGSIVGDSTSFDEEFEEASRFTKEQNVYSFFQKNPSLLSLNNYADESFQEFNDVLKTGNLVLLDSIEANYGNIQFNEAYSLCSSIVPLNEFEELILNTNSIYFTKLPLDSVYSSADTSLLVGFATHRACELGKVVYSARNMLDMEVDDFILSGARVSRDLKNGAGQFKLVVYPVPARDFLLIKNQDAINGKSITIMDLTGRVMSKQSYSPVVDIEHLSVGIYMLKVNDGVKDYFAQFIKVD